MSLDERTSVQAPIVERLAQLGWAHIQGDLLDRRLEQVFLERDLVDALVRLNPVIAADPQRADEVVKQLRTLCLAVDDEGLVASNKAFTEWARRLHHHRFPGEAQHTPIRLFDFADPTANRLVVADEVSYGTVGRKARFDIVLYVNGIPLVVGEAKTATNVKVSWLNAAKDVATVYEPGWPAFFVPGVFSFGTDGKELSYGATGAPVEHWQLWGQTQTHPKLADLLDSVERLLSPATVLALLSSYVLFEEPDNNLAGLRKLIARYMQFEAVELLVARAREGKKRRGLVYHTQGTGKTLAMVFAAGQLLADPRMDNPTVIMVADRTDLVTQTWNQFRTTNMPRLVVPGSTADLQARIGSHATGGQDQRGLFFSTVHKFAGAQQELNTRDNIVVLVDEAHRTQEGDLGTTMRAALPNALFFAFSGTPLADLDRNTFTTFGDAEDPGRAMHTYTNDQGVADGIIVPIHVVPRLVKFQLDKAALDEAFEELAVEEELGDTEKEKVARRATRKSTFFSNPERVREVCADMVEHFYATVDPLGMKAQVVVFNREACVAYHQELTRLLAERAGTGKPLDEAAVVMTVGSKDDEADWQEYALTDTEEQELLKRFRTYGDPLKFLVVTSKLGTGFNAPIEGVMYLDKPLKLHTLYQTITRTNRTWKNPETGQEKRYGLVVDYVGLGAGFARAMAPANPEQAQHEIDVDGLIDAFVAQLQATMVRFAGIDITTTGTQTLMDAQDRVPDQAARDQFAADFGMLEGIWEALWPDLRLSEHRDAYRFLAKVYAALQPSGGTDERLWYRVGAKTLDLVHSYITDITIDTSKPQIVIADADTLRTLEEQGVLPGIVDVEDKTADQIIDNIADRLKKRLAGANGDHPLYQSLADRLDKLRQHALDTAVAAIDWLREAFGVATDLTAAENAEDEHGRAGLDALPDPRVGALTQIFLEYAPDDAPVMIEKVVLEVDAIVRDVRYDGWARTQKGDRIVRQSIRNVLRPHGLHNVEGLFDAAYAYVAEHY